MIFLLEYIDGDLQNSQRSEPGHQPSPQQYQELSGDVQTDGNIIDDCFNAANILTDEEGSVVSGSEDRSDQSVLQLQIVQM